MTNQTQPEALRSALNNLAVTAYLGNLQGGLPQRDSQQAELLDRALTDAYAEGRKDEREESAAELRRLHAECEALQADADLWLGLYRRAVNEANGLTNYVEDRPELRGAERRLILIESEARAALARNKEHTT